MGLNLVQMKRNISLDPLEALPGPFGPILGPNIQKIKNIEKSKKIAKSGTLHPGSTFGPLGTLWAGTSQRLFRQFCRRWNAQPSSSPIVPRSNLRGSGALAAICNLLEFTSTGVYSLVGFTLVSKKSRLFSTPGGSAPRPPFSRPSASIMSAFGLPDAPPQMGPRDPNGPQTKMGPKWAPRAQM